MALGVSFVWFTLWIGRKWRTEPTWIDRAGRFVGLLWIVLGGTMAIIRLFYLN